MLDLVRLSPGYAFPLGGEDLYRQVAMATGLGPGQVVLDAACGRAHAATFFARNYGVEAHGIDPDVRLVNEAEQRVREMRLEERVHIQSSPLDDLPYRDAIFDVVIGEIGLAALVDPSRAVAELGRVTKPRGAVVLIVLIWTGHVEEARKERLVSHLGARPLMLMEWKQHLRDAGVVDLHVEDWSDVGSPFRPQADGRFPNLAEMFTIRQKLEILRRAMQRWGWRGVRGAIVREQEMHRLLTRQRVLGISMIRGTKWE